MTTDTTETSVGPAVDGKAISKILVAELPDGLRRLRIDTLADTLAHGSPVSPLAATVVVSAIDEAVQDPRAITAEAVEALLWHDVADFCTDLGIDLPEGCTEALHAVLSTAVRTGFLSGDGDCPRQLFAPLQQMGLQTAGRRRRHIPA